MRLHLHRQLQRGNSARRVIFRKKFKRAWQSLNSISSTFPAN